MPQENHERTMYMQVHAKYLIRKGVYKFAMAFQLLDGGASMEEAASAASHLRVAFLKSAWSSV